VEENKTQHPPCRRRPDLNFGYSLDSRPKKKPLEIVQELDIDTDPAPTCMLGCKEPAHARGLCSACYQAARRLVGRKGWSWKKLAKAGVCKDKSTEKDDAAVLALRQLLNRSVTASKPVFEPSPQLKKFVKRVEDGVFEYELPAKTDGDVIRGPVRGAMATEELPEWAKSLK
jgi:hypothetical protein